MDFRFVILGIDDKLIREGEIMKQLGLFLCALGLLLPRMSVPSFSPGSPTISSGPAAKSLRLELKEVMSIGKPDGDDHYIFYRPMDVEVNKAGEIYVLDGKKYAILKYDRDGRYLLSIGRQGQGPGEMGTCLDMALDNQGHVLLFNLENTRISKYSPGGRLLEEIRLGFTPFCGFVDSKDNIYIYTRYKGKLIHKFSPEGEPLISFMDELTTSVPRVVSHINQSGRAAIGNDQICLALPYPYTVYLFDTEGRPIKSFPLKTDYPELPFVGADNAVIVNLSFTGLAVSPDGFLFNKGVYFDVPKDWPGKINEIIASYSSHSFLDILTPEGKLVEHLNLPGWSYGGTFDGEGNYYVIKEEEGGYVRVVKYKISLSESTL
jgi:DNA-binding beta-propeller fold protein YncE